MNKMGIPREAAAPGQVPGKNPRFLENVGWMMVTSGMILSKKRSEKHKLPSGDLLHNHGSHGS